MVSLVELYNAIIRSGDVAVPLPLEARAEAPVYCDVSLPVPIDTAFTYRLPETLRGLVQPGCRVLVPFGTRKLTGVVLATHSRPPSAPAKEALRLLDEEPALDQSLLDLGRWISTYYCAPLGETLRAMTPLTADIRRGRVYSLTPSGRDTAGQLLLTGTEQEDPAAAILRLLDGRALSASYLAQKVNLFTKTAGAAAVLRSLEKKGFVEVGRRRGGARSSAGVGRRGCGWSLWRARPKSCPKPSANCWPISSCIPAQHNVAELEEAVAESQHRCPRSGAPATGDGLTLEPVAAALVPLRAPHTLNPHQQEAFDADRCGARRETVPGVSVARRDGIGKDGSLSERHRSGAGAGPGRADAGSGDRADAGGGGTVSPSLRRTRGDSAFRVSRFRARPGVAADPRRARRAWWSRRDPACSRRCRIWA